jgi:hypothetical protein
MKEKDLRPDDIVFLDKNQVEDWESIWEDSLSKHAIDSLSDNQMHWHLSRLSYLAGYLMGKGIDITEIKEKLDNFSIAINSKWKDL